MASDGRNQASRTAGLGAADTPSAGKGLPACPEGGYIGGRAGDNGGNVTRCYGTGSVRGAGTMRGGDLGGIGGLVGRNSGEVTQCDGASEVNGNERVGGLVGETSCNITNCHSAGSVSGNALVGGLVGINGGSVTWCYSVGPVGGTGTGGHIGGLVGENGGDVAQSFWDTQTSGQAASAAGTRKTTAEMQTASTFQGAGWDINDIWTICEGNAYPRLQWEQVECAE